MSDREESGLRGPMKSARTEFYEAGDDQPRSQSVITFDRDGRLAPQTAGQPGGPASERETLSRDSQGHKIRVQHLPAELRRPGVVYGFGAPLSERFYTVAGAATITTVYDSHDRAAEMLVHDEEHVLLSRLTLVYDDHGRLFKEVQRIGDKPLFTKEVEAQLPPEDREAAMRLFGPGAVFARTTHHYDDKGRRTGTDFLMGDWGSSDWTTITYNDHGDKLEEIRHTESEPKFTDTRFRYTYTYDRQGNWTEKVTSWRHSETEEFRRASVERRVIEYH
jgi:YD repeat-containing protein